MKKKTILNIKTSQSWNLKPFIINQTGGGNGTWSWAVIEDWCGGSGTENDPYLIENVTIDCGDVFGTSGITIIDSNVFFIIENCTIIQSGSASDDAGIKLLNTNNGTIRKNNIYDNLGNGIYFNNSNSNDILENEIYNNLYHGIYYFSYSDNNLISENTLYKNGLAGSSYHGIFLDTYSEYNIISENYVDDSEGDGIRIESNSHNNTITKNDVKNNFWAGILITASSNDCTISENNIVNNSKYGILLSSSAHQISIKYNYFEKNGLLTSGSGIHAIGSNLLNISGNIFDNNYYSIFLRFCSNGEVRNNRITNCSYVGIYVEFLSDNNKISNNFILDCQLGIVLYDRCDDNMIMDNTIIRQNSGGIQLDTQCHTNTVANNYLLNNNYGIEIGSNSDNNNITNNIMRRSTSYGLRIASGSENTLIFLNYFIYNNPQVVNYESTTHWNYTTLGNYWSNYTGYDLNDDGIGDIPHPIFSIVNGMDYYPIFKNIPNIYIDEHTDNNWDWATQQYWVNGTGTEEDPYIIQNKIINEDWEAPSIEIRNSIKYFVISNCTLATKGVRFPGITLFNVEHGKIEDTTITNSKSGIELFGSCEIEVVSNDINNNGIGIHLSGSEQVNVSNNNLDNNSIGLYIYQSDNNLFRGNSLLNTESCIIEDESENNVFENNVCDPEPLKTLYITITEQVFAMDVFNITFFIHNETDDGIDAASISIFWNGQNFTANIIELGNGYYMILLTPIFVVPGDPGILFEATISKTAYETLIYSTEISVTPQTVQKLYLTITEQIFTMDVFNITLFIHNDTNDGIDADSISLSWNSIDASANISVLGNGYYLVSLKPIFVEPGDSGILFEATITKAGYETLIYSSEIVIALETVQEDGEPSPSKGGIPWSTTTILLFTIIGIVSLITFYFKKKTN